MKKVIKFELGDLVQLNKCWGDRVGFVKADDTAWWVIKGCYDIGNCICKSTDVVKLITKKAVPKKLLKYV